MPDQSSKRPLGLTLLALLLAWLSIGAATLALVTPTPPPATPWIWFQLAAGFYALTALPTSVGLWRRSTWAPTAFSIWSVAALVAGIIPSLRIPTPIASSWLLPILVLLGGGAILVWIGRYVRRSIQPAA